MYNCDYHELPIRVMGELELLMKKKSYFRDPHLSD
jgi:hypothetical protein